jgi:D-arabinose 1-dehydrogenase-like Zn-dependent alcohol dehydrogenase
MAQKLGIRPKTTVLKLEQANEALAMLSKDRDDSSIVLLVP